MASKRSLSALVIVAACIVCFKLTEARDILIGGKADAWNIPSQPDSLNQWAERTRFTIEDSLVWKYDAEKDSVLQVTKEDYATCNTSNPIQKYNDGNAKVNLDHSGPYFFISGAAGHCQRGQKLIVVVLSPRRKRFTGISPAPSPVESNFEGPAAAPTSSAARLHGSLLMMVLGLGFGIGLM